MGENYREEKAADMRQRYQHNKEIGPLPKVKNPKRRKRGKDSLRAFLETYFPDTFAIPWSPDHLKMIERLERCIREGGLYCNAMPRGSGKTSLTIRAAIWALMFGHRKFVILIGATQPLAEKMVSVMRSELQFNDLLAEDFPEVCYPIRRLENETKRQTGQTLDGVNTLIKLTVNEIVLPTVKKSPCSGSLVRAAGLTGAVRGQIATTSEGKTIRPDLVLLDDPQTRESGKPCWTISGITPNRGGRRSAL